MRRGDAEREKKLAPLFQSPHLGKRSGDGVGVGLRLGTCGVDRTGNAGQLLGRECSQSPEGARSGGLESWSQAGRKEWGARSPLQIG